MGLMIGGGKGVLRVILANPQILSDYIPVDVAIKAMIIAAWKRGIKTYTILLVACNYLLINRISFNNF